MALLHGEQVIDFSEKLEVGQELHSENTIIDVADKKSGALITIESKTSDQNGAVYQPVSGDIQESAIEWLTR